jgi:hypothetical protein
MMEATHLLAEHMRRRVDRNLPEILPATVLSMTSDNTAMPILEPLPDATHPLVSLAAVFIGHMTAQGYAGHYVTLGTYSNEQNVVHVFDSLPEYTRNEERGHLYLAHLAKVGAAMRRLDSTEGLQLRFHRIRRQQSNMNSCGAFALLNLAAVVHGVDPSYLRVPDEAALRRRIHDFVFCQPHGEVPELTSLLYALEDAGSRPLVDRESQRASRCTVCLRYPVHYDERGVPVIRRALLNRFQDCADQTPASGPASDANSSSDDGSDSGDSDPAEEAPLPTTGKARAKKAPAPRTKRPVKLGSAELMPLKREGVPKDQESLCPHCGAWLFADEAGHPNRVTNEWCCGRGRYVAPKLLPYDAPFYKEGYWIDPRVRDHSRALNNMFTFAATGVSGRWKNDFRQGTSFVKIEGKIYHRIYDISWTNQKGPRKNQLCILDPEFRSKEAADMHIGKDTLQMVSTFLFASNKLYADYKALASVRADDARLLFKKVTRKKHGAVLGDAPERPQDLMPRADEVYGILSTGEAAEPKEVAVWLVGEAQSTLIPSISPVYEALAYPLLRPFAEASWEPNMLSTKGERISHLLYQRQLFLSSPRTWEMGRLGQELAVDAVSRLEGDRLNWVRFHQSDLRMGSRDEIAERLGEDKEGPEAGRRIVLPATFVGSPRYMRQKYFEGMTLIIEKGNPDLFITATCNPRWPEINPPDSDSDSEEPAGKVRLRLRQKGQAGRKKADKKWSGRPRQHPGIIARVFRWKLQRLMKDIKGGKLFGSKSVYHLQVIEYQVRSMYIAEYSINCPPTL